MVESHKTQESSCQAIELFKSQFVDKSRQPCTLHCITYIPVISLVLVLIQLDISMNILKKEISHQFNEITYCCQNQIYYLNILI